MKNTPYTIDISYSQLTVFSSDLSNPFNYWTDTHVKQGFAWRPGTVSFRTLVDAGSHDVEVAFVDGAQPLTLSAVRIIEVPFEVGSSNGVEIASIADGIFVDLARGKYALRSHAFAAMGNKKPRILFEFKHATNATFEVLRADSEMKISGKLLTTAVAATES